MGTACCAPKPLAGQLDVFRDFRDRVLLRIPVGRAFVDWYYDGFGPRAAAWLGRHESARTATRGLLTLALYPLRFGLNSPGWFLAAAAGATGLAFGLVWRRRGWRKATAGAVIFSLAFASAGVYYLVMEPATARAAGVDYAEGATYYYTLDHIGRPFNLRDGSQTLRWFEHHYPFGEIIEEEFPAGELSAGAGDYTVTWKPNFRFPGQFQDTDQYPFTQNHYREYLAEYGTYSRIDPIIEYLGGDSEGEDVYIYSKSNPFHYIDKFGLQYIYPGYEPSMLHTGQCYYKVPLGQCINECMALMNPPIILYPMIVVGVAAVKSPTASAIGCLYASANAGEVVGCTIYCNSDWNLKCENKCPVDD